MADLLDYRDPEWVAERLSLDKNAVYRYLNEGLLPGLQLGRKWLISESTLFEFLKAEEARQTAQRRTGYVGLRGAPAGGSLERFSDRALAVLANAREEAFRLNHNWIGQEHVLLALAADPGPSATAMLGACNVSPEALAALLRNQLQPGAKAVKGEIGLTPRLKKAVESAVKEADLLNHSVIGAEHLLLGLLRAGEGMGFDALESLGVSLEKARVAAANEPASDTSPAEDTQRAAATALIRQHLADEGGGLAIRRRARPGDQPPPMA